MGAEFTYLKSSRFPRVVVRSRNRAHSVEKIWLVPTPLPYFTQQFSSEGGIAFVWFCFALLCGWSRKVTPPAPPIRFKTETNCVFVTHVFPRFKHCACSYSQFPLARCDIFLCFYWLLCLLWSWFYTQTNGAQTGT